MFNLSKKPLTILLSEFLDSAGLTNSFLGKIAKELLLKSLTEYIDVGKVESFRTRYELIFNELYKKWYEQITIDLSKLQMSNKQKKMLLALFAVSLIAKGALYEDTSTESSLANKDLNQLIL